MNIKIFENEYFILKEIDGIIHATLKTTTLTLDFALSFKKERLFFANNKFSKVLVDVRNVTILTKEARTELVKNEKEKKLIALAFVSNSKLTNFLTNFYIKVNMKDYRTPTKMFNNISKAVEWLNGF